MSHKLAVYFQVKHLAGKHPQASHDPHKGGGGSSGGSSDAPQQDNSRNFKPESDYDKLLVRSGTAAIKAGIKPFTDAKDAKDLARAATATVNSMSARGYTVYSSDQPAYTVNAKGFMEDKGTFPAVMYGSGTTKAEAGQMKRHLKDNGWKVVAAAEGGGFLVGQ